MLLLGSSGKGESYALKYGVVRLAAHMNDAIIQDAFGLDHISIPVAAGLKGNKT